jgi:ureidoglycolate lyase
VITLTPQPLSASAFARFGTVIETKMNAVGERIDHPRFMQNLRPEATLNLGIARRTQAELPVKVKWLERHPFSSQAFFSVDLKRFLVLVCTTNVKGEPQPSSLQAFVGAPTQGICYSPNVWHHPFTLLDQDGEYIAMRYDAGTEDDTVWFKVEEDIEISSVG